MTHAAWIVADLLLLLGLTMRLTRLVTTDDLGRWWFTDRVYAAAKRTDRKRMAARRSLIWERYADGLYCPYCVGFWIGVSMILVLALVGGPGDAAEPWRWIAAPFALNVLVGHLNARLDG